MMKVLMISKGMVVAVYHQKLRELVSLGVDLHLIVPPAWGDQILEVQHGEGYQIYPMPIFFSGKNHFAWYRNLSAAMKRIRPDIVHIDEEHYSIVTYQAMRLSRAVGAPALFLTWQNIYKDYPFPFSAIEQYNFRHARIAIAGSDEVAAVLRRKGYVKEIEIIPLGVDHTIFRKMESAGLRAQIGIPPATFVIGFVGRIIPEKGILDLIDAASMLQGQYMVLIAGEGSLKGEVLRRASQRGISDRVRIIGQLPSLEVPAYMNCFDCLVLPSLTGRRWKEQFGRVLIEAMACEVPVIGSSSGEIPLVIGDAGLVFLEGNVSDLCNKLFQMMHDHDLRDTLRRKGKERVLSRYTQKTIAAETYRVYQKMLS